MRSSVDVVKLHSLIRNFDVLVLEIDSSHKLKVHSKEGKLCITCSLYICKRRDLMSGFFIIST